MPSVYLCPSLPPNHKTPHPVRASTGLVALAQSRSSCCATSLLAYILHASCLSSALLSCVQWAVADCVGAAQANLVKPGGFSNALVEAGKKVTGSLPNPPDASNPKGAQDVPTVSKLAKANPVKVESCSSRHKHLCVLRSPSLFLLSFFLFAIFRKPNSVKVDLCESFGKNVHAYRAVGLRGLADIAQNAPAFAPVLFAPACV